MVSRGRLARRSAAALLVMGMVGGTMVGLAGPAAAGRHPIGAELSSWSYVDSVSPFKTFLNWPGDAPVGAWQDAIGKKHISKSYFTFNLPPLRGARIFSAEVNAFEKSGNDCTKPRATELWLTDTNERPTWNLQPRERVKLPGPGGSPSCSGHIGWDTAEIVRAAMAAGQSKITLALRMEAGKQHDLAFGRRYATNPHLAIVYNFPPHTPTNLAFDNRPCADNQFQPRGFGPVMSATVTDPDGGLVSAQFAFWAVDQPDQRHEVTSPAGSSETSFSAGAPSSLYMDNRTFEWTVRGFDGDDYSAWAPSCRFTTDFIPPNAEPTISSVDYPNDGNSHGHPGIPGRFTFTANGEPDVAGFRYDNHDQPSTFVAADQLGGSATITFTPQRDGPHSIFARSVDRAGNPGTMALYRFSVRGFAPIVTSSPEDGGNGVPREFTFTPNMDDVVSYVYRFNNGPETSIAAAEDGTGRVTLTPNRPGENVMVVRSVTSTGESSPSSEYRFWMVGGPEPRVHSDVYPPFEGGGGPGVPGTFVFTPNMPNVVEYVYRFNFGPSTVTPAAPDGSASVTITPTEAGDALLIVFSRSADGSVSERSFYEFIVNP